MIEPTAVPVQTGALPLPPRIYIPVAVALAIILLIFLIVLVRCLRRLKRKSKELTNLMPKCPPPKLAGVRVDQPIQFVVPTIAVLETTEDSMSETDSGGLWRQSCSDLEVSSGGGSRTRKRSPIDRHRIHPEELETKLYQGTHRNGRICGLGSIGFSLHYNCVRQQLSVRLVSAKNLPPGLMKDSANPYAKLTLLPEKHPKFLSKVQKNTLNPFFNEVFLFTVKKDSLDGKFLKIGVWDYDRFSRKILIGKVQYPLQDAGINSHVAGDVTTGDIWVDLTMDAETVRPSCEELLLSLSYNPDAGTMTVTVIKVRFSDPHETKESSIYIKVSLYVKKRIVRTKKTGTKKKAPEVEFGESFNIHVPQVALPDIDLVVTMCTKTGLSGKRILGRTHVGSNCCAGQGFQHWQDMLASPKSTSAQWHVLDL